MYSKRPFESAKPVLKYLARYRHRLAISNSRLINIENGKARFHWKDYAHSGNNSILELYALEFIRRFLLHIVPRGFVRIRYHGFLANRFRRERLELCQTLLRGSHEEPAECVGDKPSELLTVVPSHEPKCPKCKNGIMEIVEHFSRQRWNLPVSSRGPRSPPLARSA